MPDRICPHFRFVSQCLRRPFIGVWRGEIVFFTSQKEHRTLYLFRSLDRVRTCAMKNRRAQTSFLNVFEFCISLAYPSKAPGAVNMAMVPGLPTIGKVWGERPNRDRPLSRWRVGEDAERNPYLHASCTFCCPPCGRSRRTGRSPRRFLYPRRHDQSVSPGSRRAPQYDFFSIDLVSTPSILDRCPQIIELIQVSKSCLGSPSLRQNTGSHTSDGKSGLDETHRVSFKNAILGTTKPVAHDYAWNGLRNIFRQI